MIFVPNELTDPRINLALETFLLQELTVDEPILLFYINDIGFKVFQIMGRNICDLCFYIVFDSR